jgi:DNA-binding PadR family transcriptional regulator
MLKEHTGAEGRSKDWLTRATLGVLCEEPSHGYELMQRLEEEFGFQGETGAGALYRTLRRMEGDGLCESERETPENAPARRTYSVTRAGQGYLRALVDGSLWRRSYGNKSKSEQ